MGDFDLLSIEEIEKLYYTVSENEKKMVLLHCSDDLKLNEVRIFDNYDSDIFDFIMSFKDSDKGKKAFYKFLENKNVEIWNLIFLLNQCALNYRISFAEMICEYFEQNPNFEFSLFNMGEMLNLYADDYREKLCDRLLDILESRVVDKKISTISMDKVINVFSEDKKLRIFNKFVDLYKRQKLDNIEVSLSDILGKVEENVRFDFLNSFLENNLLKSSYFISEVFGVFSDELKDEVLRVFYEHEDKNDKKIITDLVMARCLEKYASDKRLEKFKGLVLNNSRYNDFNVINNLRDSDFRFSTLDLKVGDAVPKISNEKREKLFEISNTIINNHEEDFPDGKVVYNDLIDFYVEFLGLNKDNLVSLVAKFGYVSLRYLENENIRNAINLESNKFVTLINLFKDSNLYLDNNTFNDVINSILQREFMVQCRDDYNIFSRLEELINQSSLDEVQTIILEMSGVINIKKMLGKYDLDVKTFLNDLLSGKSGMLNILHEITNQYIMKKREVYVNERLLHVNDELDLNKRYEKNFIKKKWIATSSVFDISYEIKYNTGDDNLTADQIFLKSNHEVLECIINFKKSPKEYVLNDEYKKYLKVFDSLVDVLYERDKLKDPTNDPNAKYVYSSKIVSLHTFVDLISELDISKVDKFLLSDQTLLSRLDEILSKYKLLGWGNTFSSLRDSADFEFSNNTLVGLFDYFYKINSEIVNTGDKKFSLTKMVSLANCYASSSSKYGLLFGDDIFRLISANEGKNKASMVKYKRLQLGAQHVVGMYERELVPIPPMDENISLANGKLLNVVVGNTTNMQNLALGELTNSCMRIGGAFYDFYKECLEGEVGFHIVFSEPNTEKFVSRVSGIRNGNTLFLNELRNSECEGYDNEDCVSAIRTVAKMLIEKSKQSEFPIDNVIITSDYAMEAHKEELQKLHLTDRSEALFGLKHNLDKEGNAIVLATSKDDNSLVDVQLGKDKISYYKPQRDKVREYVGDEAVKRVIQLQIMVNNLLNDMVLADINMDFNIDVVRCITGSDWFISIDSKGNVSEFILDNCKDRDRAMVEMASYMELVRNDSVDIKREGINR